MPNWDLANWEKRPVTFFEALGLSSAKIQWPKLQPSFALAAAKQGPSTSGSGSSGSGSTKGNNPPGGGTAAQNQALGKQLAAQWGWTGAQWVALNNIVMAESSWVTNVSNGGGHGYEGPTVAYGIPQALPGSKMASAGADWQTNPRTQIIWMLGYIKSTYGTPVQAWAFHLSHGYY